MKMIAIHFGSNYLKDHNSIITSM